jgi:hypothetical protein
MPLQAEARAQSAAILRQQSASTFSQGGTGGMSSTLRNF